MNTKKSVKGVEYSEQNNLILVKGFAYIIHFYKRPDFNFETIFSWF